MKHYIAALELLFNKLAALGDVIPDQVRRFHLIEGLSDEYQSVASSVMAYEGPYGAQADYAKAVQIIFRMKKVSSPSGGKESRTLLCPHEPLQDAVLWGTPQHGRKGEGTPP